MGDDPNGIIMTDICPNCKFLVDHCRCGYDPNMTYTATGGTGDPICNCGQTFTGDRPLCPVHPVCPTCNGSGVVHNHRTDIPGNILPCPYRHIRENHAHIGPVYAVGTLYRMKESDD